MALTDTKSPFGKPEDNANPLSDGDGLFYWYMLRPQILAISFRFAAQHVMAFGVYPEVSLADARRKGRRP